MNLINTNIKTMTSLDFMELVNQARESKGESKVQNRHFLARIEDELEGELGGRKTFTPAGGGTPMAYYDLNIDQCTLVGMRESKAVRRSVLEKLKEIDQKQQFTLPQTMAEALQLAADQAKQLELQAPKVEYHDKVLAADNGITTTEIAGELGMSAIKLNRLLELMKIQRKIGTRWVLTAAHLDQGLTVEVTHIDDGGKSRHSMKWTEKGRKFIHELVKG